MDRHKQKLGPPRILSPDELAYYLNMGRSAFAKMRSRLEERGFPQKHPILNGWDRLAIDAWLDKESELKTKTKS